MTRPKPSKINHVSSLIMMLRVYNAASRIVCSLSHPFFFRSIITHPAHVSHFYNSPSISLYRALPFPNSLLFRSCFSRRQSIHYPPPLSIFFRLRTPQVYFSSSELLYYIQFSSVTNALWVAKAGIRGCPV